MQNKHLISKIRQEIKTAGGKIDFARFMDLALYAPELGYYTTQARKFGREGDFVTAPEISPLFAKCFAKQFQKIFTMLSEKNILEFGAGSGIFAKDLLLELEQLNSLPEHYFILEVSAELRDQQLQRFKTECPQFLSRITWLDFLSIENFTGIIFANEVLDAMPVHRFERHDNQITECCVAWKNNQFVWENHLPSITLKKRVETLLQECALPESYRSEISLVQDSWIKSIANVLQQGVVFLIDYGYGRSEYYHPERNDGTLMCFYQHHRHSDPFQFIGLQDITAHVDFTYIAESAEKAGLNVAGFTSQGGFLLENDLLDLSLQSSLNEIEKYKNNQAIKTLTLPSEMGEIIKVMALTKNISGDLQGFALQDRRRNL
ncbi:MAG TPA: SAM-dependent methyltransferase [Gammaproteobacteria bacterium]|nr:SAM-dependent methyltransferase [Gammaproteobacteria bacterium]